MENDATSGVTRVAQRTRYTVGAMVLSNREIGEEGRRVCSDWCHNSRWLQRGSLVTAFIITASTIPNYRHRHVNGEISSTFPFHRLLQAIKCCVLCVASTVQRHLLRFRRRTDSRVGARNIALVAHWWVEWPHNQIRLQHGPIFVNRSCIHDNGITFFSIKP